MLQNQVVESKIIEQTDRVWLYEAHPGGAPGKGRPGEDIDNVHGNLSFTGGGHHSGENKNFCVRSRQTFNL